MRAAGLFVCVQKNACTGPSLTRALCEYHLPLGLLSAAIRRIRQKLSQSFIRSELQRKSSASYSKGIRKDLGRSLPHTQASKGDLDELWQAQHQKRLEENS